MSASAIIILQKSNRIAELLEDRVGVKGASLEARLARARYALPREARAAADRIVKAERKAMGGGLVDIDPLRFDDDYRLCLRQLNELSPGSVRRGLLRGLVQGGATALMAGVVLGIGLAYTGLI